MIKNRIRRKKKVKRSSPKDKSAGNPEGLTMQEMLSRIPKKERLTTAQVRHVFNDCHVQTIYKMNARREIVPYRTKQTGRSNFYLREDVESAVRKRFELVPASDNTRSSGEEVYEDSALRGARGRPRKGTAKGETIKGSRSSGPK